MQKRVAMFLVMTILLSLFLYASCIAELELPTELAASKEEAEVNTETSSDYLYTGEISVEIDGRSFTLEDLPENEAEESVVLDLLYTITGEFDRKLEVIADTEIHRINVENEKKNMIAGLYIKSYAIHDIMTLSKEQDMEQNFQTLYLNSTYMQNLLQEHELAEYEIVTIDYTWLNSKREPEWVPQVSEGRYNRSFLVGKDPLSDTYKIYDYSMFH